METLSEFVASAIEFIVGGVLFLLSVAGAAVAVFHVRLDIKELAALGQAYSTAATAIFASLAYATGVFAESVARASFEWQLDRITVRTPEFLSARGALDVPPDWPWGRFRQALSRRLLGDGFTVADRTVARAERERQRWDVMRTDPGLYADIGGQLKRLRVERVVALCLAIVAFACLWSGHVTPGLFVVVAALGMGALVNARFERFVKAIKGGYRLMRTEAAS